jgi:hypothetical protein
MRVSMPTASLTEISAAMSRFEVSKASLAPNASGVDAFSARARTNSQQPEVEALAAKLDALQAKLNAQTESRQRGGRAGPSGRGGNNPSAGSQHQCYVCGSDEHRARACPRRFGASSCSETGATHADNVRRDMRRLTDSTRAAQPFCMRAKVFGPARAWVLDSGSNRHLSPGGEDTFRNYRELPTPLPVRFGKRGSMAYAIGVGDVLVAGVAGPVWLPDVLHVPELVSPLFSVSCALNEGVSVHFDAPAQRGGAHRVTLLHGGRVILTASHRAGMYLLDEPDQAFAAAADEEAMDVALRWHRRLGHKGFASLVDLMRLGMLKRL